MEDITVSVLMTSYNREKYIAMAIESVLASTFTNFELIIVDDISKDRTLAIANSYAEKDPRVRVFVNEKNLGDYPNRNKAAGYARGKYLKYVDADDYIYPWGLELLVRMMDQFPDAGYGFCSLLPDNARWYPFKLSPGEAYRYHYFGPGIFHKAPLSAIIRRDVFEAVGNFSEKRYYGDLEMWSLLSLKYDVVLMPEGMVWHRLHEEQESELIRTDPRVPFSYDTAVVDFFRRESRIPLTAEEKAIVLARYKKRMIKVIIRNFLKARFKVVVDLMKMEKTKQHYFRILPDLPVEARVAVY